MRRGHCGAPAPGTSHRRILFVLLVAGCGSSSTAAATDGGAAGDAAAADAAAGIPQGLEVPTAQGPVLGALSASTRAFRGIPYAAPPVGDNRFRAPQPAAPWSGTRPAVAFGKKCPQLTVLGGGYDQSSDEDCLTLNVWSPNPAPAAPAPVMVFFHGGGFVLGTGADPTYSGELLVASGGVVLITVNYRLGPLGFLALPALAAQGPDSGNFGFADQQAALAWVKANIAGFGGDPGNVTIFGESAGGTSVCLHLTSPASRGLFQRAIVESGVCWGRALPTQAQAEAQGTSLAQTAGCGDPATVLSCLRAKTPQQLLTTLALRPGIVFGAGVDWVPSADGVLIPRGGDPMSFAAVPVILGTNADEGTLFVTLGGPPTNDGEYRARLLDRLPPAVVDQVMAEYPVSDFPSASAALAAATGDGFFTCPTRRLARALAAAGNRTFLYRFTHPVQSPLLPNLGAFHGSELLFVFGNVFLGATVSPSELPLVQSLMGYWTGFARSGSPAGTVTWPAYDAAGDRHLVLDLTVAEAAGLHKERCDFWDTIAF